MHKFKTLLVGFSAILMVAGCAEPKKSRGQANTRNARTTTPPGTTGSTGTTTADLHCETVGSWGIIYGPGIDNAWDVNVLKFASASVDPKNVGYVSASPDDQQTGIRFCGRLNASQEVYIGIWDDKVGQAGFETEIIVNIRPGINGGKFTNGVNPVFEDDYGSVEFRVVQKVSGGDTTGTLWFSNKKVVENGELKDATDRAPHGLGSFKIRTDRFFRDT